MKTKMQKWFSVVALACSALLAQAQFPNLLAGGESAGGSDINTVFDTYLASYTAMLEGKAKIAGALGLTAEQEKLAGQAERLRATKGKDLGAATKEDKKAQAAIDEKMAGVSELTPEKRDLLLQGTGAYAVGAVGLSELIKQVKSMRKPGITDLPAIGKFKVLITLPDYVKEVLTVLPRYTKFMKKLGVEPDPSFVSATDKLGGLEDGPEKK